MLIKIICNFWDSPYFILPELPSVQKNLQGIDTISNKIMELVKLKNAVITELCFAFLELLLADESNLNFIVTK